MRAQAATRWFLGGLLTFGVAFAVPVATPADDVKDIQKHERELHAEAKQLDADASRASSTPEGQRRLNERLAKQFKVDPSIVTGLRARGYSYGQATIALALSQELMKRDKSLSQQAALDKIVAERQAHKGWGVIAHDLGLKLGHVVSEVRKVDKAADHIAGKPESDKSKVAKVDKAEKPDKLDKPDKFDKPEKPAKPERPGR